MAASRKKFLDLQMKARQQPILRSFPILGGMVCHNFRAEVLNREGGVSPFSSPLVAPERRSEEHALPCVLAVCCPSDML